MTALSVPGASASRDVPAVYWPWKPALVLLLVFAASNWTWSASKRWYASDSGDVNALVNRIEGGEIQRQVGMLTLGVFGLGLCFLPASRSTRLKLLIAYPVMVFLVWALISCGWSTDKMLTFKRLIVFAAMVLTTIGLVRRYDILELARIAFLASLITMLVGMFNEIRLVLSGFPGFGLYRFGGTMHPNHSGLNCAMVMLASLYLFRHSRGRVYVLTFALGLTLLLLTKSRTALMSGVTACCVYLMLATSVSRAMWALLLGAWAVAGVMWLSSLQMMPDVSHYVSMGRDDLKNADVRQLTGRTDIWKFSIMQADKNPNRWMVGYGFESFWTPENARGVSEYVRFKISEGHNAYLDWYLELGLVGAGLYVAILLLSLGRWARAALLLRSPSAALAAGVIAGAVLHGLAESSSGDANLPALMLFTSIGAACVMRADEEALS